MLINHGIKGRIYPTEKQKVQIAQNCGSSRFVWNQLLGMLNERYRNNPSLPMLNKTKLTNLITPLKDEYPFLKTADSTALQYSARKLSETFDKFFKKQSGYPNFKRKGYHGSYRSVNNNNSVRQLSKYWVQIPKLGRVKYRGNPIRGKILFVTVTQSNTGEYFASFNVQSEKQALEKTGQVIGIDLGVTDFAVLSNGQKITMPKYYAHLEEQLHKWEKLAARRLLLAKKRLGDDFRQAKNYQVARLMVAKLKRRIKNQRMDFLHKLSRQLVEDYDVIVVEKLNVSGLVKNRKLSRAISEQAWGEFTTMLSYKSEWYGSDLIQVDPKYTSQICSACGVNTGKKPLHVRAFTCFDCGTHHDRDINAARNILKKGVATL